MGAGGIGLLPDRASTSVGQHATVRDVGQRGRLRHVGFSGLSGTTPPRWALVGRPGVPPVGSGHPGHDMGHMEGLELWQAKPLHTHSPTRLERTGSWTGTTPSKRWRNGSNISWGRAANSRSAFLVARAEPDRSRSRPDGSRRLRVWWPATVAEGAGPPTSTASWAPSPTRDATGLSTPGPASTEPAPRRWPGE